VDGAGNTHMKDEKYVEGFGGGNLRQGDILADVGVNGIIMLKWVLGINDSGVSTGFWCFGMWTSGVLFRKP